MKTQFITGQALTPYTAPNRMWQGIPGIEVSKGGRIFYCAYSGGITEGAGNFAFLLCSTDGGKTFQELAVADPGPEGRTSDPTLWIDPLGRLWFIWATAPQNRVEFVRLDDPDGDLTTWSEVKKLGFDIMLNKPIVLSTGEWIFPIAVWDKDRLELSPLFYDTDAEPGSYAYVSRDQGKTFEILGASHVRDRFFDEHMILEMKDGSLKMFVRAPYGIGVSESFDGGNSGL